MCIRDSSRISSGAAQSPGWFFIAEPEDASESEVLMVNTRGSIYPLLDTWGQSAATTDRPAGSARGRADLLQ